MPLSVGDRAPEFELPDHDAQMKKLSDYRGSPVVLLFFPAAFTSVCTEELCTVGGDLDAYERLGGEVLAISVDSPFVLSRFRQDCDVDFTFLSDFNRTATRAYEVQRDGPLGPGLMGVADRAAFVIDGEGEVTYVWHSTNPGNLPPFDEIKDALEKAA